MSEAAIPVASPAATAGSVLLGLRMGAGDYGSMLDNSSLDRLPNKSATMFSVFKLSRIKELQAISSTALCIQNGSKVVARQIKSESLLPDNWLIKTGSLLG